MDAAELPSWEEVLAECEETAAHAEALLRSRTHEPLRPSPPRPSFIDVSERLPEPSAEVLERAHKIHDRHLELQRELSQSMREIEHRTLLITDGGGVSPRKPSYIDRTA
jgi:hypothetical protein